MSDKKPANHVIVLEPVPPSVAELLAMLEQKNGAEIVKVPSVDEAFQLVGQHAPCMVIAAIADNSSIPATVNLLKKLEPVIKRGRLKTLIVSKQKNRQLGNLITGLGVTDYVEEPIPVRTLYFKSNLQLKAVETIRKQEEAKKASQERIVFKKTEQAKEENSTITNADASKTKLAPALQVEKDTFLFKGQAPRKMGKKLVLEMEGPAPDTGEWVPHEDKGETENAWRWVPEEEKDSPEAKRGDGWVHSGDKPQFNESTKRWQFVSEKPDLSLYKDKTKTASKVSVSETGEIQMAMDSAKAEENVKKSAEKSQKKKAGKTGSASNLELKTKVEQPKLVDDLKFQEEKRKKGSASDLKAELEEEAPETLGDKAFEKEEKEDNSSVDMSLASRMIANTGEAAEIVDEIAKEKREEKAAKREEEKKGGKEKRNSTLDFLMKKKAALEGNKGVSDMESESGDAGRESRGETEAETGGGFGRRKKNEPSTETESLHPIKDKEKDKNRSDRISALKESLLKRTVKKDRASPGLDGKENDGNASESAIAELSSSMRERKEKLQKAKAILDEKKQKLLQELGTVSDDEEEPEEAAAGVPGATGKKRRKDALMDKIRALEEKLGKVDGQLEEISSAEENEPGFHTHDLSEEDPENTWSRKGQTGEAASTKRRAFDSRLEEDEEDSSDAARSRKKEQGAAKGLKHKEEELVFLIPEKNIKPVGGAWEKAGPYYVYVSGDLHYHAFDTLESLLPLWVYKGEKIPEMLAKTREWKFLHREALAVKLEKNIPAEVKSYLFEIKTRVEEKKRKKNAENDEADTIPKKKDARQKPIPGTPEEEFQEDDASMAQALEELGEESARENTEEQVTAPAAEENGEETPESEDDPAAKTFGSQKARKKRDELKDKLASLKESLGKEEEALKEGTADEEKAEESAAEQDAAQEEEKEKSSKRKLEPEQETPLQKTRKNTPAAEEETPSSAVRLERELGKDSPKLQDFFERRKKKPRDNTAAAQAVKDKLSTVSPYLAIYVALSDALQANKGFSRYSGKLFGVIASSIADCSLHLLESAETAGKRKIVCSSGGGFRAGQSVETEGGLSFPVSAKVANQDRILGYLWVRAEAPREEFQLREIEALKKAASLLGPLVLFDQFPEKDSPSKETDKAA